MMQIADYEVIDQISESNQGTLFRARPPTRLNRDDELVALKVLGLVATDAEFRRFGKEMRALGAVNHPNVVEVLDAGHQQGRLFFAMPYHARGALADAQVGAQEAMAAVRDCARGAHALHEAGILHRDITTRNMLLAEHRAVLGDLGLADLLRPGMTSTGIGPIGGLADTDALVLSGDRATRSSEVFSLGSSLHRAVTGVSVRPGIPEHDVVAAIRFVLANPPRLSDLLPAALGPVVERCLAADPDARYPHAAALADDIDAVLATTAPEPT